MRSETKMTINEVDYEKGFNHIVEGLMKGLEETFGESKARDIAYKVGFEKGQKIGKEFGKGDPEEVLERFIRYISPYHQVKIVSIERKTDGFVATIQIKNCVVKRMIESVGLKFPAIACMINWGFFEGALSSMTLSDVKKRIYESSISKMCVGTITISGYSEEKIRSEEERSIAKSIRI